MGKSSIYITSELLAEKIVMKHPNLIRKITNLHSYSNFRGLVLSSRRQSTQGKTYNNYSLTLQGTLFLLLSLTEIRYRKFQISIVEQLPSLGFLDLKELLDGILADINKEYVEANNVSVYIVTDGKKVKVGRSKNVEQRLLQLQTSNPKKLCLKADILVGSNRDAASLEKFIHNILDGFSPDHCSEWFDISFDACIIFLLRASVRSKRLSKNKWFLDTFLKYYDKNYKDIFSVYHRTLITDKTPVTIAYDDDPEPCYTIRNYDGELIDICETEKEAITLCRVLGLGSKIRTFKN